MPLYGSIDGIISSLKQHSGDESRIEELRLSNKELKTSNSLLEEEKRSLASILADKREEIKKAHGAIFTSQHVSSLNFILL